MLIIVESGETQTAHFRVQIIPAAPENIFADSKLRPTKNSIRPKQEPESDSAISLKPSPFYNASIKSDCSSEAYLKLFSLASKAATASGESDGFKDACILGRIWLRQRGFGSSIANGGFGHFEWAALTSLLLKGGGSKGRSVLSPRLSSSQMFKGVINYLATSDLITKPQSYETVNSSIQKSEFTVSNSDVPMFYDGPRGHNILYKMTPWSYSLLREEARTSIEMLNEPGFDSFESTFIIRTAQPLQRFDCVASVPMPLKVGKPNRCEHQPLMASFSSRLFGVLREGLTDRVKLINIKQPEPSSWSIKSSSPAIPEDTSLQVQALFDPVNIGRLVDDGPLKEEKEKALAYYKFWGDKAEQMIFGGRTLERVVWQPGSAYSLFQQIVTYLVKRYFDEKVSEGLTFVGEGFEKLLPGSSNGTKNFSTLRTAYTTLESELKDLNYADKLPLQLKQLSPIDPQLRSSAANLPSFSPWQPLARPANVNIDFEGSGSWPDEIDAIQRTKVAFLQLIGDLLEEKNSSITTRVGLENEDRPFHNCAFLDVVYESGAVFRLKIHAAREQALLERHIKDTSGGHRLQMDAVLAFSVYTRTFLQLPLHTQSVLTQSTRYPSLSPTIRLVKKWFYSHMLSTHIGDELIELIVMHVFVQPYPWRAPSSTMAGFLRTLSFLARWDWRLVPLIVDFTSAMTASEVSKFNAQFVELRKRDPAMNRTVLFVASNHGTAFSDNGPSKVIAARMTALARSACKLVKDAGTNLKPKSLFATSTANYDFVLHIAAPFVAAPQQKENNKRKFKNLEVQSELDLELLGYEPVQGLLEELRALYASSIVFFNSADNPAVVGGVWNPQAAAPRAFKYNVAYPTKPVKSEEEDMVQLDKAAILSEIARLGGDMLERIEIH